MRAFLYFFPDENNPTKPMWYAGLGVPFKLTPNFSFAAKVDFRTTATDMLLKQLERTYGNTFYFIPQGDAMPHMDSKCASCGLGWTDRESDAIRDENALPFTHMASPLRTSEADSFSSKVSNAITCRTCKVLLCGSCAPAKRGRNANTCRVCAPKKHRRLV